MTDYTVKVTIFDLNISRKSQTMLKKLNTVLSSTFWKAGNISEKENSVEFFENQILMQDIHVVFHRDTWIEIKMSHEIDRDNLDLIEKILKCKARIRVGENDKLILDFSYYEKNTTYTKHGKYTTRHGIPMSKTIDGHEWNYEVRGFKWTNRIYPKRVYC